MRIAVIADAMSAGFTFPVWHRYYSSQFGAENLFIITYAGADQAFEQYPLRGLQRIEAAYSDDLRIVAVADFISKLLDSYDAVVRVDVDEFLVADPQSGLTLRGFIETSRLRHITARGFDLIPSRDDAPIDFSRPVLQQRKLAFALTAMNKTAITRDRLRWGRGFHYCSSPPALDGLILLHLKRIDFAFQRDWATKMMKGFSPDSFEAKYYRDDLSVAENFVRSRWSKPASEGFESPERTAFDKAFLSAIRLNPSNALYEGPYDIDEQNVILPNRFLGIF